MTTVHPPRVYLRPGGDKASEEKFKEISQAYQTIIERLST